MLVRSTGSEALSSAEQNSQCPGADGTTATLSCSDTAVATIEPAVLRRNLQVLRARCPRSRVMAMVKGNGYGHGLIVAARAFDSADGLAVARLAEARVLRNAQVRLPMLLLGTLLEPSELEWCARNEVAVVVHDRRSLEICLSVAGRQALRVWLKLDSGMHRLGLAPQEFLQADRSLRACPGIAEIVHMTHFAAADDPDPTSLNAQAECFEQCRRAAGPALASLANSAALLRRPSLHADWVRPGILLYGSNPFPRCGIEVRPAMTLSSRVIALRRIRAGESVGYGGSWTARRPSAIATLGIGYGDGYPRHAACGTPVLINGARVPLVGRVSMDSISVDVTDAAAVQVGDEAILWGPQLPPTEIAHRAGTISYELLASLPGRLARIHQPASVLPHAPGHRATLAPS